ncbi:MAG: alcohol dehydrogenase catalytic domain-containing protein [Actinomycetota bacterium]
MKGLTFHGRHDVRVDDVPDPAIQEPTDALVRVTLAGICGSDLHVYNAGDRFGFPPGTRLGHEIIGTVEAVGRDVTRFRPGDRVLSSCSVADGDCVYCREGLASSCRQWSLFGWAPRVWRHGGDVQGGQSQYARIPLADTTLLSMPEELSGPDRETALLPLVDVASTAMHGLATARVQPGMRVAVIGDGAVGLSCVHVAHAIGVEEIICLGHHDDRLQVARRLGATATVTTRDADEIRDAVRERTGGEGVHAVMDSISSAHSMAAAHAAVRAGGAIACLGMDHFMGNAPEVNWYDQFLRNITITGGLVPGGKYIPRLLDLVRAGRLDPAPLLTHRLPMADAADGYRMMAERRPGVIKVCIAPGA